VQDQLNEVAERICEQLDWDRPELQAVAAVREADGARAAAIALVQRLRSRTEPRLIHGSEYVELIRSRATDEQRRRARARLEDAFGRTLIRAGYHSNPFSAIGTDAMILVQDEPLYRRIGEAVLAARAEWGGGAWGVTRSLCELITDLLPVPECPDETFVPLLGWLLDQSRAEWEWSRTWSERSLGTSGHNWWLHTFMGFYEAALFFPEVEWFGQFGAFMPTYFEFEMNVLMEEDGYTRERASGYHSGTLNHWLQVQRLADVAGVELSPEFHERLRRVAETEWKTMAPSGEFPHMGDTNARYRPDRSLERLRRLAALFEMPEAKFVAEALAPDWRAPYGGLLMDGGRNVLPEYERLQARAPEGSAADTVLPRSGYYFMRQDWTRASDWVCIEAGPLGSAVQSHNHTHVFNLELYSRGRPILIDNGNAPYGDSPERMWRVSSAAHNVATVDGADHIPIEDEWRWKGAVIPTVDAWRSEPDYAYFSGAHEGYRYLADQVAAGRRKLFYLRGKYWILIDRFTPETDAGHDYTLHFQIGAPCRLDGGRLVTSGAGGNRLATSGGNLLIVPVEGLAGTPRLEPCPYPLDGYENPEHLTYTRHGTGGQIMVTLLVPFDGEEAPDVAVRTIDVQADGRTLSPWEATGLEIEIDGQRDVYVDQHMQWNLPWQAGGHAGEGRLFHSRVP